MPSWPYTSSNELPNLATKYRCTAETTLHDAFRRIPEIGRVELEGDALGPPGFHDTGDRQRKTGLSTLNDGLGLNRRFSFFH